MLALAQRPLFTSSLSGGAERLEQPAAAVPRLPVQFAELWKEHDLHEPSTGH